MLGIASDPDTMSDGLGRNVGEAPLDSMGLSCFAPAGDGSRDGAAALNNGSMVDGALGWQRGEDDGLRALLLASDGFRNLGVELG